MGWRSSSAATGVGYGLLREMVEQLQVAGRLRRSTRRVI
eukprot:SAG31_NODE_12764_length_918_cov_1.505495_1_plen_38_part_01